jgi:hypothetical protein
VKKPIADMTDAEFLAEERARLERGKRAMPHEGYVTRLERFIAIIDRMEDELGKR